MTTLSTEKEDYILTKDDEDYAISHAIIQLRKHKCWKMEQAGMNEQSILAKISSIDWEAEINKDEILQTANSNKLYDIWQKEQREKELADNENKLKLLKQRCDAIYFYRLMFWSSVNVYEREFIKHDDNTPLIKIICFFLSRDIRFETELNYSLKKGLLIRGVSGLGKTFLIKCVKDNELNPIDIFSTIDIAETVKEEGNFTIQTNKLIYLDDVGTEEHIVNHYGTKINWVKNFIELYYTRNFPFNKLIVSTNNSFQEIEEKYGFRVRSRIKEMFNVINVSGKDMRE